MNYKLFNVSKFSLIFFISFIFLYPYLAGFLTIDNFQLCNAVAYHDCTVYSASVKDVYDGNIFIEDIYVTENKNVNVSAGMAFLNPLLYAIVMLPVIKILGFTKSLIIAKLFFVILLFLFL